MNAARLYRILLPLLLATTLGSTRLLAYDAVVATSPDHPKTWVDGAIRAHQGLHWSPEKHLLLATVTYSTANFADNTHPTEEDTFQLAFPTVHFDSASGRFTAGGMLVATLHHGLFGETVSLAPDVDLSIHRHEGVVFAKLLVSRSE
jgi:hypothetical protein